MALYKGTTKIKSIYKGTTKIAKIYKGTTLIYSASKLPNAFQEVEYIESSKTQYIDTGLHLTATTGVMLDIQFTGYANQQAIGVLEPSVGRFAPCFMDSDNYIKCAINLQNQMITYTQTGPLDRNVYEYNISNNDIKFNGTSIGTVGNIGTSSNTIYLFGRNYQASPLLSSAKLYSCKIYDNNTLARDFVPCYRKADNVAGLYDLVNGVFYTNAGTGTFIVGCNV